MSSSNVRRGAGFIARILASLALSAAMAGSALAQRPTTGLVAHYPLDNSLEDVTSNAYDGLATGGPVYAAGIAGQALRFDGVDDVLRFARLPNSVFAGDFTVAWYMNAATLDEWSLLSKRDACTGGNWFEAGGSRVGTALLGFSLSRTGIGSTVATARQDYFAPGWLHVAVVRRGSDAVVYVDGVAGEAAPLGTLNFSAITAQLGFSSSPCIGTGSVRAYQGLLDDLRVYNRALDAREIDTLASIPQITVTPASIAPGGSLAYTATELDVGTTYSLRLFDGAANPVLDSFQATSVEQRRRVLMPNAAAGRWPLRLQVPSPRLIVSTHASTTLTVTQGLDVAVRTAAPQAGKSLLVDVSRLAPGRLQLRYAGRIVAGPITVDDASTPLALRFVAPSDIPPTFPANVELRAELLVGRNVARSGTAQVTVAAPFSGPFALPTGVTGSAASGTPSTPLNVRGRLQLVDGATPDNVQFSAFWVGDDGSFTPLPTHALALASDGTFDLTTRPSGLATMTAGIARGLGRIRLVAKRLGPYGRAEWQFTDGPAFTNNVDVDAQTDITFTISRVGGNINERVEGALIVFDPVTPIQEFDLPPAPPAGDDAGYTVQGQSLFGNLALNDTRTLSAASNLTAVSQVDGILPIEQPEPACGPDLFRRYTDANGRASIDLLGSSVRTDGRGQTLDFASFLTQGFRATQCSGGACVTAQSIPLRFRARIYTVHRGAGVIVNGREDPLVLEFLFDRQTRVFTIRNLRSGQTTTQTNSVNLSVQVPVISTSTNYVYVQAPYMFTLPPTLGTIKRESDDSDYGMRQVTFSGWVSFHPSAQAPEIPDYSFVVPPPRFSIGFWHRPDAGGALTSARLYIRPTSSPAETLYGNFTRESNTPLCTLQDDGSFAGNHLWLLEVDGNDWRNPGRMGALAFDGDDDPVIVGRIEYRNAAGAVGSYPVRFEWKGPPNEVLDLAGSEDPVLVNDRRVGVVQFQGAAPLGDGLRTRTFISPVGGNDLAPPHDRTNQSTTTQLVNVTTDGEGGDGGARVVIGDVANQYNEGPRSRDATVSVSGDLANFGSRDYTTLLDQEVLLMQVTWGIPGLAGVDAYASMRLLAQYWFGGKAGLDDDGDPYFEALTDAVFSIGLIVGIDIDVLFGLLFDAGVNIAGYIGSSMQTSFQSNDGVPRGENCFNLFVVLGVYFDPCPICPTPAISESYPVIDQNSDCPIPLGTPSATPLAPLQLPSTPPQRGLTIAEQRSLRRHVAMRFDDRGNGGMLSLDDSRNLTFASLAPDDDRPPVVMSTAAGQRQPSIAYHAPNKAISVWVENALTPSQLQALDTNGYSSSGFPIAVRNQRLAWSKFNGSTWTPKRFLTLPGNGEAFPVLEACPDGTAGCPVGGSVFLAFQRNINGNFIAPRNRIFHATWSPSAGWSAVTQTPAGADATQDITPSVVFVDGRPLLTWVRIGSANQLSLQRRLMWQFPGLGAVSGEDLPDGANSLSLIAQPLESGRNMFGAFMVPEANTGIIGSGQALHLLRGLCTIASQTCDFAFVKASVDGQPGSAVYGDRPNVRRSNSGRSIYMRVYSFTPKDPVAARAAQVRNEEAFEEWRTAKDPLHKQAALRGFEQALFLGSSAELYRMTANFLNGEVVPTALTFDGGNYLGATSAYDSFRDRFVVAGAPIYAAETAAGLRAQAHSGALSRSVPARTLRVVNGLELRETDDVPDLRVDAVRITRGAFGPSQRLDVTVTVSNAGSPFRALADGPASLHLRLGAPTGRGAPLASVAIPDLADGAKRDFVLAITTPADAFADEESMLYASLVLDADTPDLDGNNNFNVLPLPGLPAPTKLLASTRMGMSVTQLQWRGSTDPRVVGYRVYRREADGQYVPLGASAVEGFLDLSSQFGVMRTYAVSSYSARGVESPLSDPTGAAPEARLAGPEGDEVFRSGFESPVP